MKTADRKEIIECGLHITKNARKGIEQWFLSEQAFVSSEAVFDLYIEKKPANRQGNQSYALYFDPGTNEKLAKEVKQRVAVMECVMKPDGLLATGFHLRGEREPVRTNRRLRTSLSFQLNRSGVALPIDFYTKLRELPVAEERSEYVKKRIESWEGYLQIAEKNADVADMLCTFSSANFNKDFTKLQLYCHDLQTKNWKQLRGFSVQMAELQTAIGQIVDVQPSKKRIDIELKESFQRKSREADWLPRKNKQLLLTNFAELSQIRRLRKGFKDLQDGLAANANLEKLLFEERPVVQINNKKPELQFHNRLNKYQQEAVAGAMQAHDLYVIQGPPGTGKTTVISEICYQNVKAGLRTLVTSQSNLAVDNALGRLLSDPETRILRYGRTESIEEEGKRFIEENVSLNWRDETMDSVRAARELYRKKEIELTDELLLLEKKEKQLCQLMDEQAQQLKKQQLLKKEIAALKKAAAEQQEAAVEIAERLSRQQASLEKNKAERQQQEKGLEEIYMENTKLPEKQTAEKQLATSAEKLHRWQQIQQYIEYGDQLCTLVGKIERNEKLLEKLPEKEASFAAAAEAVDSLTKLASVQTALTERNIELPIHIILRLNELQKLGKAISTGTFSFAWQEWKALQDRFKKAIQKTEEILVRCHYPVTSIGKKYTDRYTTIEEMNEMIDQLANYLIQPATKDVLNAGGSPEKTTRLNRVAENLAYFYSKAEAACDETARIQRQIIGEAKQQFVEVKKDILRFLRDEQLQIMRTKKIQADELDEQRQQRENTEKIRAEWLETNELPDEIYTMDEIAGNIASCEDKTSAIQQQLIQIEELKKAARIASDRLVSLQQHGERSSAQMKITENEQQRTSGRLAELAAEMEDKRQQLQPDLENCMKQTEKELAEAAEMTKRLTKEQQQLPVFQQLQSQWELLLQDANDYDLDEIRKLYVEHANVIGTTCVASASKKFMEEYPVFDVVIIDEVSKATPPELLLPMLKGKKIILVGDHHQLPPLVGQETMDELVEQQKDLNVKEEMKKLLNESLFERLFRTLPKQNKTMLSIQYRMHEKIMQTIAPFYKEGNYELQCGLSDSDNMRDHLLESPLFSRSDHVLWFDTPNEPPFYEEKVKGGTSRWNESELSIIKETLIELEKSAAEAKKQSRLEKTEKKSVGIISFYGEQVKQIDRLIHQTLRPAHLHCRTGSVDKFQGMEMDIIILSFVRNHGEAGGDIGFAKDYRRLNVALSRARELLIIVGSSEMFTKKTKNPAVRIMYGRVKQCIEQHKGMRTNWINEGK